VAKKPVSDKRAERLQSHALWPEIELRLRHGKSPESVNQELSAQFPDQQVPSSRTLRRFVESRPASWFVSPELRVKLAKVHLPELSDDMTVAALEEIKAELDEVTAVVKRRVQRAIANEDRLGAEELPVLIPEVGRNQKLQIELLREKVGLVTKLAEAREKAAPKVVEGEMVDEDDEDRRRTAWIATMDTPQFLELLERLFPAPEHVRLLPEGAPCGREWCVARHDQGERACRRQDDPAP
jgi:hypothetical protein